MNNITRRYPEAQELLATISKMRDRATIFPPKGEELRCFSLLPNNGVKVVIVGQDPYFRPGQANGLAFSVNNGIALPKSLKNIYKAVKNDYGEVVHHTGDLTAWAEQGVLLLNNVLTVEEGKPNSHKNLGWQKFTDHVISDLDNNSCPIVFMLWGNEAQKKIKLLHNPEHLILTAPHPSARAQVNDFLQCGHFKKCNEYLVDNWLSPIIW